MPFVQWIFAALLQCVVASLLLMQCSGKKGGKDADKDKPEEKKKDAAGKSAIKKVDGGKKETAKESAKKEAPKKETSKAAPPPAAADAKKVTAPPAAAPKPDQPKSVTKQPEPTQRTDAAKVLEKSAQKSLQKTQQLSLADDPKSAGSEKPSIINSKAANPKGDPKEVKVEPEKLSFKAGEDKATLKIENLTDKPLAMKLKCSDNEHYKFKPVFFLVKPKEHHEHEISRKNADKAKVDKLLVVYTEAKDSDDNAKKLYDAKPAAKEISVGLVGA